jgi:hypothetical protein
MSFVLVAGLFLLALPTSALAQDDPNDMPLGDLARSFRKKPVAPEAVIDNDNLSKAVEDAAARHAAGTSPVFSLDPGAKSVHASSPDVTCSLSFTAKTTSPFSDTFMLDDLPRAELAKLDGPASMDGDSLQVSVHNGSAWELREVVIGLTIVRQPPLGETSFLAQARLVPAAGFSNASALQSVPDSSQKQPDVTMLLHVKGSAAPSATATFRTPLNFALFPDQEWHWAIVRAKGIPPPAPPDATTLMQSEAAGQPAAALSDAGTKLTPPTPPREIKSPSTLNTAPH